MIPRERIYRVLVHAESTVDTMLRQTNNLPNDTRAVVPYADSLLTQLHELEVDCRVLRRALEPIASHKE